MVTASATSVVAAHSPLPTPNWVRRRLDDPETLAVVPSIFIVKSSVTGCVSPCRLKVPRARYASPRTSLISDEEKTALGCVATSRKPSPSSISSRWLSAVLADPKSMVTRTRDCARSSGLKRISLLHRRKVPFMGVPFQSAVKASLPPWETRHFLTGVAKSYSSAVFDVSSPLGRAINGAAVAGAGDCSLGGVDGFVLVSMSAAPAA